MLYGKQIADVEPNFPYDEIWISLGGDDTNSGSRDAPLATWTAAWTKRKLAPATRYSIIFDSGIWLDPTVMVFDDIGADTAETYIHGIQDGNIPRYSSGAANIQMTNCGNVYFTGFGFYEGIEINQTGTRVCSAQFLNVTIYGTVTSTGIAVPDNTQLMITGANGRLTVENLAAADIIVPMRVQGSAYLDINGGDLDCTKISVFYSGQLYTNRNLTIGELIVFGDGQINVLGTASIIVNDTIEWSGGTLNTWGAGTYDHSGATVTTRDERVHSEYHKFVVGASGLTSTNVQEAITELAGLVGGGGGWAVTGTTTLTGATVIDSTFYDLAIGKHPVTKTTSDGFLDFTDLGGGTEVSLISGDWRSGASTVHSRVGVFNGGVTLELKGVLPFTQTLQLNSTGVVIISSGNLNGAYYGGDYSTGGIATHGDRWIPDKGFADGAYWKTSGTTNIPSFGTATIVVDGFSYINHDLKDALNFGNGTVTYDMDSGISSGFLTIGGVLDELGYEGWAGSGQTGDKLVMRLTGSGFQMTHDGDNRGWRLTGRGTVGTEATFNLNNNQINFTTGTYYAGGLIQIAGTATGGAGGVQMGWSNSTTAVTQGGRITLGGSGHGNTFEDFNTTKQGLKYEAAGYVTDDRSLVDKGFADGAYWATSGDTSLTGTVNIINGTGNNGFYIKSEDVTTNFVKLQIAHDGATNHYGRLQAVGNVLTKVATVEAFHNETGDIAGASILYFTLPNNTSVAVGSHLTGIALTDGVSTTGAYYAADYSTNGISNHGDRWIPDYAAVKAYADSPSQEGVSGTSTDVVYTMSKTTSNAAGQLTGFQINYEIESSAGAQHLAHQWETHWRIGGATAGSESANLLGKITANQLSRQWIAVTSTTAGGSNPRLFSYDDSAVVSSGGFSGGSWDFSLGVGKTFRSQADYSAAFVANSYVTKSWVEGLAATKPDRVGLNLTTGDVATPAEGQIWYNNTTNKFRAFENAAAVDIIGGGGGLANTSTNFSSQTDFGTTSDGRLRFETVTADFTVGDMYMYNVGAGSLGGANERAFVGILGRSTGEAGFKDHVVARHDNGTGGTYAELEVGQTDSGIYQAILTGYGVGTPNRTTQLAVSSNGQLTLVAQNSGAGSPKATILIDEQDIPTGTPLTRITSNVNTNTGNVRVLEIERLSASTSGANDIAGSFAIMLEKSIGQSPALEVEATWTDATATTEESLIEFHAFKHNLAHTFLAFDTNLPALALANGTASGTNSLAIGGSSNAIGADSISIGFAGIQAAAGGIGIGRYSQTTAQGSIMIGYHTAPQQNTTSDSLRLAWDGTEVMKVGLAYGMVLQGATGGQQGTGTINTKGLYIDGVAVGAVALLNDIGNVSHATTEGYVLYYDATGSEWTDMGSVFIYSDSGAGKVLTESVSLINEAILFRNNTVAAGVGIGSHIARGGRTIVAGDGIYVKSSVGANSEYSTMVWEETSADGNPIFNHDETIDFYIELPFEGTRAEAFRLKAGGGIQIAGDNTQSIKTVHLQLTTAQVLALNTTAIELVAAPASGQYIQILGASAKLNHVTSAFVTGSTLELVIGTGSSNTFKSTASFINNGANLTKHLDENSAGATIAMATALDITADADSTGGGTSTIDVYVQYVIVDAN